MSPEQVEKLFLLERLGVAMAIGLMIGLERGWEQRELHTTQRIAGLRTFAAIGLLGGVMAQLGGDHGDFLIAGVAIALGSVLAIGYWRESEADRDLSLTTAVSALVTYGLGALAGRGELLAASSSAVALTMVLGFRPELHNLVRQIDRQELLATFRLLLISIVLLPVLPNRGFGPWQALNPYAIWWMVVLVAALSYVGYFGTRWLGAERGILATGLFGGLASSTVVALSLARRAAREHSYPNILAAGATAASAVMLPRIFVIVSAINPLLAAELVWPLAAAGVAAIAATFYLIRRGRGEGSARHDFDPGNPLDLATAIRFGALLAVIIFAARAASAWAGNSALFLLAAISGLVDVDAISLSVATMSAHGEISLLVGAAAIMLAAAVNTVLKPGIGIVIGGATFGSRFLASSLAMIIAGAAGAYFAWRVA